MKFVKFFTAVLLISAVCTTNSGIRKFASRACNSFSQEELVAWNEIMTLFKQAVILQNEIIENTKLALDEKNELFKQMLSIASASGRKSAQHGSKIDREFKEMLRLIREHQLQLCNEMLTETQKLQKNR